MEWLIRCLGSDQSAIGFHAQEAARKAVAALDSAQRTRVLEAHHPDERVFGVSEIVHALVAGDPEVYGRLLQLEQLKPHHLCPLLGEPSGDWRDMAVLALDHGYSSEDVVDANLGGSWSWEGKESDMWAERRGHFERLQAEVDFRVAEIGRLGATAISKLEQQAKEMERREAIHGLP